MLRSTRPLLRRAFARQAVRRSQTKASEPARPPAEAKPASTTAGGPMSWKALAVFAAAGTAGLAYYSLEKQRRMEGKRFSSLC